MGRAEPECVGAQRIIRSLSDGPRSRIPARRLRDSCAPSAPAAWARCGSRPIAAGAQVAIKVLLSTAPDAAHRLGRFEQEARASSALSHPNICHIYHLGETPEGDYYIAMEYVEGETLDQRLLVPLTLAAALEIAIQIAAALTPPMPQALSIVTSNPTT